MKLSHVVVDGSNIATEGRETPSLAQLDEAVQAFIREFEPERVTVVVDATFPNRINRNERQVYEDVVAAGEVITPPAGAIGRGDAFVLQIADRAGATILSNDSFQEFHGDYLWLFDKGRLVGGKPVPHVGWVFMDRAPVRGPASRRAVSEARREKSRDSDRAERPARRKVEKAAKAEKAPRADKAAQADKATTVPKADKATKAAKAAKPDKSDKAAKASRAKSGRGQAEQSAAPSQTDQPVVPGGATTEMAAATPAPPAKRRRGRRGGVKSETGEATAAAAVVPAEPVEAPARSEPVAAVADVPDATATPEYNEPGPYGDFLSKHPVGSDVEAVVESFGSHGAYLRCGSIRAYAPLKNLADPAPRSAKEVLKAGETRTFVVAEVDRARRGVDLALADTPVAKAAIAAGAAEQLKPRARKAAKATKATKAAKAAQKTTNAAKATRAKKASTKTSTDPRP